MPDNPENNPGQNAGTPSGSPEENNSGTSNTENTLNSTIRAVSSAGAKALHYAAEMSKTKWFAVVAIILVGLVLAKLSCQGYHPEESTGIIEVRNSEKALLLKTDANGKVLESIYPEREMNQ